MAVAAVACAPSRCTDMYRYANAAKPTTVEALFLNPILQYLIDQIEGRLTCFLRGREIRGMLALVLYR